MDVRSLGFRTDLMVRSRGGASVVDLGDHIVVRTPDNPEFRWGNFLLVGQDQGNAERWLSVFAAAFPEAAHVAIGLDGVDGRPPAEAYASAGLSADTSTVLTAERLVAPGGPTRAATIRPLDGDADWDAALDLHLAVYPSDDPAYRLFAERQLGEARHAVSRGPGAWFGAFGPGGELVGQLGLVADGPGPARFQNVATHPDWRGRGLATGLVHAAGSHALSALGATSLVIVADPDYFAIDIYRRLGFTDTEHQVQLDRSR